MTIEHSLLNTSDLHTIGYKSATDPGAIGAGICWIDTSEGSEKWVLKVRNDTNTGWEFLGDSSGVSGVQTLTDGATISWDLDNVNGEVTLGGDRTLSNPTNGQAGHHYILKVTQDATGGRLLSYGTNYRFSHGVKPGLSTTAGQTDILTFYFDGTYMHFMDIKTHMTDEWSPTEVTSANLDCWLDANQITGKSDGEAVSSWADVSGSGVDHSLTTSGGPTFETNFLNGYPVVKFSGSDNATFAPGPWAIGEGSTYIIVAAAIAHNDYYRMLSGSNNWLVTPARKGLDYVACWHRNSGWQTLGPYLGSPGTFGIMYMCDKDGTNGLFRVNGANIDTNITSASGPGNIYLGGYSGAHNGENVEAYIAELLIYDDALSAGDMTDVEDYLNAKYSIY